MARQHIAATVGFANGVAVHTADLILAKAFEEIAAELAAGNRVSIANFGTFEPVVRPPRQGLAARPGTVVSETEPVGPRFRPAPKLRRTVNDSVSSTFRPHGT